MWRVKPAYGNKPYAPACLTRRTRALKPEKLHFNRESVMFVKSKRNRHSKVLKRRNLVEQLEDRQLLAADPLTSAQKSELTSQLSAVTTFADHVDESAELNRSLGVIGSTFQSSFDASEILNDRFVTPLMDYIESSDATLSSDDVANYLTSGAIVGVFGDVTFDVGETTGGEEGGDLVFDTTLYARKSVAYNFDPGAEDFEFSSPSDQADADFGMTFDLRFGVDAASNFFVEIDKLELTVDDVAQVVAGSSTPTVESVTEDVVFTLLINEATSISATLPANTPGNQTPLADRLNGVLEQPLRDAGLDGAIEAIESQDRLAFRSASAQVTSIEIFGDNLQLLGFDTFTTTSNPFTPEVGYGLLGLETVAGGIAIDGAANIAAADGGDGRLNSAELNSSPLLTVDTVGATQSRLTVRPATGAFISTNPSIEFTGGSVFENSPVSVSMESFEDLDGLHDDVAASLTDGFDAITQFGGRLETETPLANPLPAMDAGLGEKVDLDAVLRNKLQSTIENLLATNPRPSWDEVASALASVPGVSVSANSQSVDELSLSIQVTDSQTSSEKLVLGESLQEAGFGASEDDLPDLSLQTSTDWSLDIAIDRTLTAAPLDAFGVAILQAESGVTINSQPIAFDGRAGFLGVTATGAADLNATLESNVAGGQAITAAQLLERSVADLVVNNSVGSFDLDLAVAGTIGGQTINGSIDLPSGDVFGGQIELQPVDFSALENFINVAPDTVVSGLNQVAGWLTDFATEKLGDAVPLADATRYADALDLAGAFENQIVSLLKNEDGQLTFATAQEFDGLSSLISNPNYDSATRQLTFEINYNEILAPLIADLSFDFEVGDFVGLSSDAMVTLTPSVQGTFRLGIDMRPLGAGDEALAITPATLLSDLNNGMGILDVDAGSGDDVEITLRDGTVVQVRFDGESNLADVLDALDDASPDLSAELYEVDGITTGIELTDTSVGESVFAVKPIGDSLAGLGLGILGKAEGTEDESGPAVITGLALHGDTIAHHVFVEEIAGAPIATGTVQLANNDFSATANLGFTEVTITGGRILDAAGTVGVDVPSNVVASVGLPQPKMTLADLFAALDANADAASAAVADFVGSIHFELPTIGLLDDDGDGVEDEQSATLVGSITDLSGDLVAQISGAVDAVLARLSKVDAGDILDGLKDGLADLLSIDGLTIPILNIDLPNASGLEGLLKDVRGAIDTIGNTTLDVLSEGINRLAAIDPAAPEIDFPELDVSLPDLFSFFRSARSMAPAEGSGDTFSLPDFDALLADLFDFEISLPSVDVPPEEFDAFLTNLSGILDSLELSGPGSLQSLEQGLENAIGLNENGVSLQIITGLPGDGLEIRFDLLLDQTIHETYPLSVDLESLGVSGVGDLIDVAGSATVDLTAGAAARLSFGLEISSDEAVRVVPFLYTDAAGTSLSLTAGASSSDINFDASLGPLGVGIVDGSAGINASGTVGDATPATFTIGIDDPDANDKYFIGDAFGFQTSVAGGAFANLPIDFPVGDDFTLSMSVTDDDLRDGNITSSNFNQLSTEIQNRIDQLGNLDENLLALVGGWEGAFDLLTDAMRGDVLGVPLPIIGDALADEADFLDEIKQSVLDNIRNLAELGTSVVQTEIFNALGPAGLNLLLDQTGSPEVTVDDVMVQITGSDRVDFDILLGQALQTVTVPVDFDLGLPGLNLDVDAPVDLDFGYEFDLGFGVSIDEGFYFDTTDTQLTVSFDAAIPDLDASGQLALLGITATSGIGNDGLPETRFDGDFVVTLADPTAAVGDAVDAQYLTLSEMFASDFSDVVQHTLGASAQANLHVVTTVGESAILPSLRADLVVDWDFVAGGGNTLTVDFDNVEMNLGDFFGGFVGDTLSQVQEILEPVQPVIDVLTAPLPVMSDLSGSDVTLVDMARLFGRSDVADFVQSIIDVNDLITGLPDVQPGTWVALGDFDVDASTLGGFEGPGSTPSTMVKEVTIPSFNELDALAGAASQTGAQGATWRNNLNNAKGSLTFPLIQNPINAFKLLLGKDVDLFLYDAPALGIDFGYNQSLPTPIPGLFAEFGGRISAIADFAFGFDTTGINKFSRTGNFGDIFDGFFVSDRVNPDGTGADIPEVVFSGSLTAGAKVNVLLAEAGVRGGVYADVNFNLHDDDGDGRVRGDELADSLSLGPVHIFDVDGTVDAGLTAFYRFLLFEDEYEIASVNLLDFDIARPVPGGLSPTDVLTSRDGDVLTIKFTQQDDVYKILPGSQPGSIIVQGQNLITDDIVGVNSIVGNAGDGNDTITISPDVFQTITLDGGAGNDVMTGGGGAVNFSGGAGNDELSGSPEDDRLDGGDGDDVLIGGEGNDTLIGGAGADYLDGGRNEDNLSGGDGADQLFGGLNADEIDGGAGDDNLNGGRGDDVMRGGDGEDVLSGGRGNDSMDGGDGDDKLFGEEGADSIEGGSGDDEIEGGERNDTIDGGAGNDTIDGGTGNDEISGGADDDVIRGAGGADVLSGDGGNDLIYADSDENGDAEAADHTIQGGTGNDTIYGSLGVDVIDAGGGLDRVVALAGDDVVIGGLGDDDLDGGLGNDLIWGGLAAYDASSFDISDQTLFEKPLRFDEVTSAFGSAYTLPLLVTPKVVGGLSVPGIISDGDDSIRGGDGTDILFGGSGSDAIFGGAGHDYIDGGAGDDLNLFGGEDDDVIRGGTGSDIIHGGLGIDQSYGDEGRDAIYGDGGTLGGSTDGQRAFGGDDVDSLYAWAAGNATDVGAKGDELFGESGGDFLYGNLRDDLLVGEAGPDYLSGDWAAGPDYARNSNAALNTGGGGDDTLLGGTGQDQAYGGGGDDLLQGGGDGDWLEGQDGNDELIGGGGIDFLVLDVNPNYSVLSNESLDGHGDGSPEDNATDVLLVNGTSGDDVIRFSQTAGDQLKVSYNGAEITADWTDAAGPLVEQFRIDGGVGDDTIEFVRGADALDLSELTSRSRDWVTTISGGPGDDTIVGSDGRDRIDGGRGSDTISGFAGDDRLWGDEGSGSIADHDVIYAGQGNDDLLGGQGTNELYAWSSDPGQPETDTMPPAADFGVFELVDGQLQLEDTGLNRIIGGANDDLLFGGTGLDLLYGAEGNNQLYTRTGERFESLDGGDAGNEWKEYAKSTDQVWYVGGTNVADQISVDFVTEPGILQGHHLVTRLTENNGSFSFDAQVRLDFSATDDEGNLVWDPETLFFGDQLLNEDPFARAEALNDRFSDADSLSTLLPPEDEFRAIIIDSLAGDDVINVGPTVQKTVWIDAGEGDDEVLIASGRAILIDQTDPIGDRNDQAVNAYELAGPPVLVGDAVTATNGVLQNDASFYLIVDDLDQRVLVEVPARITDGSGIDQSANTSLDDLVDDINQQLARTAASGLVIATRSGDAIALSNTSLNAASRLAISVPAGDPANTKIGLPLNEEAMPTSLLSRSISFTDLTIDNPSDVDHYQFSIDSDRTIGISTPSIGVDDGMTVAVFDGAAELTANVDGGFDLVAGTVYTVRVQSNAIPTIYELQFDFGDDATPVVSDLGAIVELERQDAIFGGPGNDVLQGGPGEDFIFGGPGNDVLTGGDDRGTSDLLFGQSGDDLFQIVTDALPTLTGSDTTFLPTQSDRYDGGIGFDNAVYLGGDVDENGLPVEDFVAIRFNRLLQRYEVSDFVWDTNNQQFIGEEPSGEFLRHWQFFTLVSVEQAVADLRAGDDEFHGEEGFVFPADSSGSEWGIAPGDRQAAGGSLVSWRVDGGAGKDRIFGTANDDILSGGDGDDYIAGGLGDDQILGGDGKDTLLGNAGASLDRSLSEVDVRFTSSFSVSAAELPVLNAGDFVPDLATAVAGGSDYYLLYPKNEFGFGDEFTPLNLESRLIVHETVGGVRNGNLIDKDHLASAQCGFR